VTRTHRSFHRLIWVLLALGVGVALLLALLWREPAHAGLPPPAAGDAR
jgi:hypothetical protein